MSRSPDLDLAALRADPRVLWHEDVLRFGDTDANGHINNSAFAIFCESGRVGYFNTIVTPTRVDEGFFVIAELTIAFRAELFFPGRVRSGTWLGALGRTSMVFRQVLLDDGDKLVATSEATTVAMDGANRRPAPLGPATRAVLEARVLSVPVRS